MMAQEIKETKKEVEVKDTAATEKTKKGKGKVIFILILTLVLIGGAATGFYFISQSMNYLTTDNARVTTDLIEISSGMPGVLERLMVYEGRYVYENEILGWVENGEAMRSPVDGIVVHSSAVQGQMVSPLAPVAVVASTNHLHIQANIEETYITRLQVGQPAIVTIDAFGSREFAGYISDIGRITAAELSGQAMFFNTGGTFTRVTHLIPIKINITDDVALENFIGVNARVRIPLRVPEDGFWVAPSAPAEDTAQRVERRDVHATPGFIVEQVYVEVGDFVTEGQVLARLDTQDLTLSIAQQRAALEMTRQNSHMVNAEASLTAAEINLTDAQENHRTLSQLYGAGAIPHNELRQAEIRLQSALESRNSARELLNAMRTENSANSRHIEASLRILEKQLQDSVIKAPISGAVTAVFAREGAAGQGVLFIIESR